MSQTRVSMRVIWLEQESKLEKAHSSTEPALCRVKQLQAPLRVSPDTPPHAQAQTNRGRGGETALGPTFYICGIFHDLRTS